MAENISEKEPDKEQDEQTSKKKAEKSHTPLLEWVSAAAGLILVGTCIGFLIYQAITRPNTFPQIVVRQNGTMQYESGYLVKFTIENKGESNASNVVVEGKLMRGENDVETSSVTIDYAPSHSSREGGFFFTKNPGDFDLQIRPLGYEEP